MSGGWSIKLVICVILIGVVILTLYLAYRLRAVDAPTAKNSNGGIPGVVVVGTVCLADGVTPESEAVVCIYDSLGLAQSPPRPTIKATANVVGAFKFDERLKPGNYAIKVFGDHGVSISQPLVVYNDGMDMVVLQLKPACEYLGGAVSARAHAPHSEQPEGVDVLGTVCLADGVTLLPGENVYVYDAAGPATIMKRPKTAAVTNAVGAFVLNETLKPGIYTVEVLDDRRGYIVSKSLVVFKDQGDVACLKLKATSGSLSGLVYLPSGEPARNASVEIADQFSTKIYFATTDSKGRYAINAVLPGDYLAVVNSNADDVLGNHLGDTEKGIVVRNEPAERDFTLHAIEEKQKASKPGRV